MNLAEYLNLPEVSQGKLAAALGVSQSAVSQWVKKGVPAERVPALVRESQGRVTAHELRPDLYPQGFEFPVQAAA